MNTYKATKNLHLKQEDLTVLDGGIIDLEPERADDINGKEMGALVLISEEKPKRTRKKAEG